MNREDIIIGMLVFIVLWLFFITYRLYSSSSGYTLAPGTLSLMSLQEFSSIPADIRDFYNEQIVGRVIPETGKYVQELYKKEFPNGYTDFRAKMVPEIDRLIFQIQNKKN